MVGLDPRQSRFDAVDIADRTSGMAVEPSLIELSRDEVADRRMQSTGLGQKYPSVGRDGRICRRGHARAHWLRRHPGARPWRPGPAAADHPEGSCSGLIVTTPLRRPRRVARPRRSPDVHRGVVHLGEAKNHEVPATRLYLALAAAALPLGYLTPTSEPACDLLRDLLTGTRCSSCPFSSKTEWTAASRLSMAAWPNAEIPTRLPERMRAWMMCAPR